MANIDVTTIQGFDGMTAEQKVEALLKLDIPERIDMSKYVSKETADKYASEAAEACIAYGFEILGFEKMYSYMKYTNIPSMKTAMRNGFHEIEEYADEVNGFTKVFMITKEEWRKRHEKNCGN